MAKYFVRHYSPRLPQTIIYKPIKQPQSHLSETSVKRELMTFIFPFIRDASTPLTGGEALRDDHNNGCGGD